MTGYITKSFQSALFLNIFTLIVGLSISNNLNSQSIISDIENNYHGLRFELNKKYIDNKVLYILSVNTLKAEPSYRNIKSMRAAYAHSYSESGICPQGIYEFSTNDTDYKYNRKRQTHDLILGELDSNSYYCIELSITSSNINEYAKYSSSSSKFVPLKLFTADCVNGTTRSCQCSGVDICLRGRWDMVCWDGDVEKKEVCDGLDNNCNGQIDENLDCHKLVKFKSPKIINSVGRFSSHLQDKMTLTLNPKDDDNYSHLLKMELFNGFEIDFITSIRMHYKPINNSLDDCPSDLYPYEINLYDKVVKATFRYITVEIDSLVSNNIYCAKIILGFDPSGKNRNIENGATEIIYNIIFNTPECHINGILRQCGCDGRQMCMDGFWSNCEGNGKNGEICDGIDNNCNGQIDENLDCSTLDFDRDKVLNEKDNCPWISNPQQLDNDNDSIGNECDCSPFNSDLDFSLDSDFDGICNNLDKCPFTPGKAKSNGCPVVDDYIPNRIDSMLIYEIPHTNSMAAPSFIKIVDPSYIKLGNIDSSIVEVSQYFDHLNLKFNIIDNLIQDSITSNLILEKSFLNRFEYLKFKKLKKQIPNHLPKRLKAKLKNIHTNEYVYSKSQINSKQYFNRISDFIDAITIIYSKNKINPIDSIDIEYLSIMADEIDLALNKNDASPTNGSLRTSGSKTNIFINNPLPQVWLSSTTCFTDSSRVLLESQSIAKFGNYPSCRVLNKYYTLTYGNNPNYDFFSSGKYDFFYTKGNENITQIKNIQVDQHSLDPINLGNSLLRNPIRTLIQVDIVGLKNPPKSDETIAGLTIGEERKVINKLNQINKKYGYNYFFIGTQFISENE